MDKKNKILRTCTVCSKVELVNYIPGNKNCRPCQSFINGKARGEKTRKDATGVRSGKLIAVSFYGRDAKGDNYYNCLCDCGNQVVIRGHSIRLGKTKSCGCFGINKLYSRKLTKGYTSADFKT